MTPDEVNEWEHDPCEDCDGYECSSEAKEAGGLGCEWEVR